MLRRRTGGGRRWKCGAPRAVVAPELDELAGGGSVAAGCQGGEHGDGHDRDGEQATQAGRVVALCPHRFLLQCKAATPPSSRRGRTRSTGGFGVTPRSSSGPSTRKGASALEARQSAVHSGVCRRQAERPKDRSDGSRRY